MIRAFIAPEMFFGTDTAAVTRIVIVDPQFDAYRSLAADARNGRYEVHFRASGAAALKLLSKWRAEAVIVGEDLDDMSGHDFVDLLGSPRFAPGPGEMRPLVLMAAARDGRRLGREPVWISGGRVTLSHPITGQDVEAQIRAAHRPAAARISAVIRAMGTLPIGVSMAVIAIALLLAR